VQNIFSRNQYVLYNHEPLLKHTRMDLLKEIMFGKEGLKEDNKETLVEAIKSMEIREGIQTVETTREPEKRIVVAKEAVLQETIKPIEKIEIQPVLHRER
jgi:hypothetical protein